MRRLWMLGLVLVLLAACGGQAAMMPTPVTFGTIELQDIWARAAPAASPNAAFYMQLRNTGSSADALIGAATDVCGTVELHEMAMAADGVMAMRPVEGQRIPLPAGETVMLQVGGLHVMCLAKTSAFDPGMQIPLTLTFEQAGTVQVTATVREVTGETGGMNMDG